MSTMPDPSLMDAAHGQRTELSVLVSIPTVDLFLNDHHGPADQLAHAAVMLAQEEGPNKAVALLLGSALDSATRGDSSNVVLAMRAAVVVLQDIATSQLRGVVR